MSKKKNNLLKTIKEDYFNTPVNAIMTILVAVLVIRVALWFINWAILDAVWTGESRDMSHTGGVGIYYS